jgi:hypothetical protein
VAIFDMDDEKLKVIFRANAPHFAILQNDILNELDRRASRRQTFASAVLSVVGLVIALAALVVTALKS